MLFRWVGYLLVTMALFGCGGVLKSVPFLSPEPIPHGHDYRASSVTPQRYFLDISLDPAESTFSGEVHIDAVFNEARERIFLHGGDLLISEVVVESQTGVIPTTLTLGEEGRIALDLSQSVAPGPVQIRISYTGRYSTDKEGLFRIKEGGRAYIFSRFQPSFARRVFPGFDRPDLRTPIALSIQVPAGMTAVSSTPAVNIEEQEGRRLFHFKETKALPLHLLGLAVGPFDIVDTPSGTLGHVPFRILTAQGKSHLTAYSLAETTKLFRATLDYFDQEYPDEKLDILAVPGLPVGALEQHGLISVREELLLVDPSFSPADHLARTRALLAHELAHMWIGSLVSPATWEDRWIFEAFATFWSKRSTWSESGGEPHRNHPGQDIMHLLRLDATDEARPIQGIAPSGQSPHSLGGGFAYGKGAALLRMYEHWLGVDAFRRGIREFVAKNAHRSVSASTFFRSLDLATGQPISRQSRWYINQAGAPWIHMRLTCDSDIQLHVQQRRDRLRGSKRPQGNPWSIPFCIRYGEGQNIGQECHRVDRREMVLTLGTKTCPTWIFGNADLKGYYRWSAPEKDFQDWVLASLPFLTPLERSALPDALLNAHLSGRLSASAFVHLINAAAKTGSRGAFESVVRMMHRLDRWNTRAESGPALGRWLDTLVSAYKDASSEASQDETFQFVRDSLAFIKAEDRTSDTSTVSDPTPSRSYWQGTLDDWKGVHSEYLESKKPLKRFELATALGSFNCPGCVEKSLDLVKEGTVRGTHLHALSRGIHRRNYRRALSWLDSHGPSLLPKLTADERVQLLKVGHHGCSEEDLVQVKRIFASTEFHGHALRLKTQITSNIRRCIHYRRALGEDLSLELDRLYP